MKNILHIVSWFPNEEDPQLGVFVEKHVKSIAKYNHSNLIYVDSNNKNVVQKSYSEGLTIYKGFYKKNHIPVLCLILNVISYYKAYLACIKQMHNEYGKADIVHAHVLLKAGVLALDYKRRYGVKMFLSEHWSGYVSGLYSNKSILYKYFTKLCLRKSTHIFVVSDYLKDNIIKLFPFVKNKISVIPNVVESIKFKENKIDDKSFKFLCVADLVDEIKNISSVIKVISKIDNVELTIIGDGPDFEFLNILADDLGVNGIKVFFKGQLNNTQVLEQIPFYDVLILNSRYETFSVVICEAILAGVPVISTKCGGPEGILNEKNSILIDIDNNIQLQEAIYSIINKEKIFDLTDTIQILKTKYSSDSIGLEFINQYRKYFD